jgi:hypothetical protein
MLAHPTSQCLTSFTNIQKSTECTFYTVNDIFSRTVQRFKRFGQTDRPDITEILLKVALDIINQSIKTKKPLLYRQ